MALLVLPHERHQLAALTFLRNQQKEAVALPGCHLATAGKHTPLDNPL